MPSEAVLIRLASIAVHAEELLAPDQPTAKARVGLTKAKNDRRRTMEALLVLLADPEVRHLGDCDYGAANRRCPAQRAGRVSHPRPPCRRTSVP